MQRKNIDLDSRQYVPLNQVGLTTQKVLGKSISECPEHINDGRKFGYWEINCIVDKKTKDESILLTLAERKTCMEILRKLYSKSAAQS